MSHVTSTCPWSPSRERCGDKAISARRPSGVSSSVRAKVNYLPNGIARSLVSGRTHTIGLVVPDLMSSFLAEVAKGISEKVRPFGYQVLISISEADAKLEREEMDLLLARRADALVLASAQPPTCTGLFRAIEQRKVPY